MNEYSTLSKLRTFLDLGSADVTDDTQLKNFLINSSRAIDRYTRRSFYPSRKGGNNTLKYDLPRDQEFRFQHDILDVHGLSDMNGASEINENVYWLKTGDDWNLTPYDRLILDDSSGSSFSYTGTPQRAVHLDAVVGYNENYGEAWVDSGGSLTDALGAAITLASVSASGAADSRGLTPRFSQGQIWRLGTGASEEYVYVQDTTDGGTVRLIRGINGSSAVAHAASTAIHVWEVEPDIEYSARELAAFMYLKAVNPHTTKAAFPQLGMIETPNTWPEITIDRLSRYKKSRIYSL